MEEAAATMTAEYYMDRGVSSSEKWINRVYEKAIASVARATRAYNDAANSLCLGEGILETMVTSATHDIGKEGVIGDKIDRAVRSPLGKVLSGEGVLAEIGEASESPLGTFLGNKGGFREFPKRDDELLSSVFGCGNAAEERFREAVEESEAAGAVYSDRIALTIERVGAEAADNVAYRCLSVRSSLAEANSRCLEAASKFMASKCRYLSTRSKLRLSVSLVAAGSDMEVRTAHADLFKRSAMLYESVIDQYARVAVACKMSAHKCGASADGSASNAEVGEPCDFDDMTESAEYFKSVAKAYDRTLDVSAVAEWRFTLAAVEYSALVGAPLAVGGEAQRTGRRRKPRAKRPPKGPSQTPPATLTTPNI